MCMYRHWILGTISMKLPKTLLFVRALGLVRALRPFKPSASIFDCLVSGIGKLFLSEHVCAKKKN